MLYDFPVKKNTVSETLMGYIHYRFKYSVNTDHHDIPGSNKEASPGTGSGIPCHPVGHF